MYLIYLFFSHVALHVYVLKDHLFCGFMDPVFLPLIGLLGRIISLPQSFYFYLTCQ